MNPQEKQKQFNQGVLYAFLISIGLILFFFGFPSMTHTVPYLIIVSHLSLIIYSIIRKKWSLLLGFITGIFLFALLSIGLCFGLLIFLGILYK